MIKIEHVNKTFTTKSGEVPALQDVSLEVEAGDIYGVITNSLSKHCYPIDSFKTG